MTSVVLIDDQALIRSGLRGIVEDAGIVVLAEAANGQDGVEAVRRTRPDVVLMDLRMPVLDGVSATASIRADGRLHSSRVLVLTTFDGDRDVLAALSAGADGFIGKDCDPEDLVTAITTVAAGGASLSNSAARSVLHHLQAQRPDPQDADLVDRVLTLTVRERDVVLAAARGLDNARIARELVISPATVKTHLNRAMLKLDARDRGQLVSIVYRSGLMNRS